jgi:TolC family type I secretion outer membrane protein
MYRLLLSTVLQRLPWRAGHVLGCCLLLAIPGYAVQAADALTLEAAVSRAIKANPQLQAWRFERDAVSLEKDIARGQHYPALELGASYTRYSDAALIHPIGEAGTFPPFSTEVVNAGLSLRLPLYAGGKLVAGEQLATYREQDATQQLRRTEQALIFNVVSTYAKALQLADLSKVQARRLRSLAAQVREILRKQEEGQATRLDALRVRSQLSSAQVDHAATLQGEQDALTLLAALMDQPSLDAELATTPAMLLTIPPSIDHVLRLAHEQHPQIAQARAQLESAQARVDIARGDGRPRVDLLANTQTRRGDDWEGRDDWDVGVALSVPLFDGGVRRSRVDQANARRLRAQQDLRDTVNQVSSEARAALGGLNTASAQLEAALRGLEEAEEAMRIESLRYDAGRSTVTDLLSAEAARWSAMAALNQAKFDGFVAQVRLLKALGELKPDAFDGSAAAATGLDSSAGVSGARRASGIAQRETDTPTRKTLY